MQINEILDAKKDVRKDGDDCLFNGYLEDYAGMDRDEDPVLKKAFKKILENNENAKIIEGLKMNISRTAISNQIIRYKDIFKLEGKPIVLPYIIYGKKEGVSKAILVLPYTPFGGLYAKGLYYCKTEPGGEYIDCKNDIVALCSEDPDVIADTFEQMFTQKAGILQRKADPEYFLNYEKLTECAKKADEAVKEEVYTKLAQTEDREAIIRKAVVEWFLLKKVLYVRYMVDKKVLHTVHADNARKQRNQAKINADGISFISYSEMWRYRPEEKKES